jgi:hypothetical protein
VGLHELLLALFELLLRVDPSGRVRRGFAGEGLAWELHAQVQVALEIDVEFGAADKSSSMNKVTGRKASGMT